MAQPKKETSSSDNRRGPLDSLLVIDRLEVSAPRLERDRLVSTYTVTSGDQKDSIDLVYSYEEQVFDPADPASHNLAAMIGAQIALNYGLFCREIVFRGPFDRADQKFLSEMAENTACEIFVNKFLEPNVFLLEPFRSLPAVRQERYCRAQLSFPDLVTVEAQADWNNLPSRHLVLSSGGKDSLLSYCLLEEIGCEVHPVFGNESGRHWFTALNAYRYFRSNVPLTSRVWMNSDRVFNRMLRHLPFIRKDFAEVRSDSYPIRLWTVAVFIFGVLPLARKRGIGRIVIGDEFDSTVRETFQGIQHYAGLYDQSRFFDEAMTRYYVRKGWGLNQFSILRPLSELLIEKILVERYGAVQKQQVSCHATHMEDDRVRPCGKCEKCRRIVGMLVALGADPSRCGYQESAIEPCLEKLVQQGVHQETAAYRHLLWKIDQVRPLKLSEKERKKLTPKPEIEAVRFDQEHSPLDNIPEDLRRPLYQIFLDHANGSLRRRGRPWVKFDALSKESLQRPYRFASQRTTEPGLETNILLGELTWPDAQKRFREVDVAILPVGAIEQHGPHLPLDTDAFDADYLAKKVAEGCRLPRPLVLPLIPYGVSYHHDDFSGTLSVSNDTLSRMVYEVGISAARNGVTKLVIINGHGGNGPALNYAAQMINRDAHIFVCVDSGETSDVDISGLTETPNDVHAGEVETSTSMAIRPHLVKPVEATGRVVPQFSSRYLDFTSTRSVSWYAYTRRLSANGVMGDPSKATAEKGHQMWKIMIEHLVNLVEDLKHMTLDEIFQRRY